MIKLSALFLVLFIGTTTCLDISASSGVILPSIESKNELFNMMVQVRSETNQNTISGFVQQLRDLLNSLVQAQNKHKEVHQKMMTQCKEENIFRTREVRRARRAHANALAAKTKCEVSLKNALNENPDLENTRNVYAQELSRAQQARTIEASKYNQRRNALSEAVDFLRTFLAYVKNRLAKEYSLLSLSEDLLKHANKVNVVPEASPILAELATAMMLSAPVDARNFKPNAELRQRLIDALTQLLNRLEADSKNNIEDEQKAAAVFEVYRSRLTKVISTLDANIARVKEQITKMRNCINVEGGVMTTAASKLARNLTLRLDAGRMCHAFNNEFIEATKHRLNEIETMKQILDIVAKRFKKLPKDLVAYLESVANGWRAYVNSTAFKDFIEYQRKTFEVNQRGKLLAVSNADEDRNPVSAVVRGAQGIA